ncbi:helix-turn-helix domain-containing protein [Faecalibacterium sp. AF27-11BH]|jgi:excisionase family DNA binding protein|uniref:helix-turn-helix domain-containing protein n=1 Tax=Faecalibacterium sp. AF27-11BH TaxID=2302956 RepID=UPI000E71357D|nr:helix-turn-helix domain-containing protein [Faecalibacterium sp. AF27-11BH]RJV78448.1 DNA-binding protein [Faecalibacterium sp. AF27-11BH]
MTDCDLTAPLSQTMGVMEMAKELGIGRNKAYILVKQRDFPAFRIGRTYRVIRADLPEWIKKQSGKTYYYN